MTFINLNRKKKKKKKKFAQRFLVWKVICENGFASDKCYFNKDYPIVSSTELTLAAIVFRKCRSKLFKSIFMLFAFHREKKSIR